MKKYGKYYKLLTDYCYHQGVDMLVKSGKP